LKKCVSCGNTLLDFQRICEKCGTFQPETYQPTQQPPQASAPAQPPPEQARPIEVPRSRPPPSTYAPPTERKVKPLLLASVVIIVVVLGVVAVALLAYNPFAAPSNPTTAGGSCTVTKNVAAPTACGIGNNLYLVNLLVSNSSYSNHPTYVITFVINNTGTTAVNITSIKFDNQPVINGYPTSDSNATSPFWSTYSSGHAVLAKSRLPFVLQVPRTTSSGAHNITLVDLAGKTYTFNFDI
jgi:hypothetical protein